MIFIGNRIDTVRTTQGHTIFFPAEGAEVYVPDDTAVQKACIDRGHQPKKEPKVKFIPVLTTSKEKE
jgi:hypothetical protein